MSGLRTSACNWPTVFCGDGPDGTCSSLDSLDPAIAALCIESAVEYLWHWTGQQFGTCPVTIRPCKDTCAQYYTTYRGWGGLNNNLPYYTGFPGPLNPALIAGEWWNLGCGGCGDDVCSCSYVPTVTLKGPVASVDSVYINGDLLDPTAYRVDNYGQLVRTDGGDWPACQNQTAPPTEDNTFEVTYQIGTEVPAGGQLAAGRLACETAKMLCGDSSCQLPSNLSSVSRQGVTINVESVYQGLYSVGTTGIWIVDRWVGSIQSSSKRAPMKVASPDLRHPRRTTWP